MVSELNMFFFADFALQNMIETTLPDGLETSGISLILAYLLDVFEFFHFGFFFSRFLIFFWFYVFLVHPTMVFVLLFASVERFNVSRMHFFFFM